MEQSPLITSSVIIDKYGSIKINISIVAIPVTTDDKVLHVVLRVGNKHPAYKEDNTPTFSKADANIKPKIIFLGIFLYSFIYDKFFFVGIVIVFLNCSTPPFENPYIIIFGTERYILNASTAFENNLMNVGVNKAPINSSNSC